MKLHDLRPNQGATHKRKRVGRGSGSGVGKTSGRGTKGQNSRTGGGVAATFEGGQLRLVKRLPKLRGFNNRFKVSFVPVNLDNVNEGFAAGSEVSPASLYATGLLGKLSDLVVLLARGEVDKALHVKVHRASKGAQAKIEAAGGSVEILPYEINKNLPRS
ncbi:MAG: 50S ribosomal protein L15 [Chloroflexi bacterium]|nr:MAG: 50S ribosomal protein L15 [Chloroflexota bacterium]